MAQSARLSPNKAEYPIGLQSRELLFRTFPPKTPSLTNVLIQAGTIPCNERPQLEGPRMVPEIATSAAPDPGSADNPGAARRNSGQTPLSVEQILAWADAHHIEFGVWPPAWPGTDQGQVVRATGEPWAAIDRALVLGLRGLPGHSSLAELLAEHRGASLRTLRWRAHAAQRRVRDSELTPAAAPPPDCFVRAPGLVAGVTIDVILAWADVYHAATGRWPGKRSGPVEAAPLDVSWRYVDQWLRVGQYGLPGGTTLRQLLTRRRIYRKGLTVEAILAWADSYHAFHGCWPKASSIPNSAAPGESWRAINKALQVGRRGLPGGSSLKLLLAEHRSPEARLRARGLGLEQILAWADAHHAATGRWPKKNSGTVAQARAETWMTIDNVLRHECSGKAGNGSLARLLSHFRGARKRKARPPLSLDQIRVWAIQFRAETGNWPSRKSGPVAGISNETWGRIDAALSRGTLGLPGGTTLRRFLNGG
jgi:hypothetical protein